MSHTAADPLPPKTLDAIYERPIIARIIRRMFDSDFTASLWIFYFQEKQSGKYERIFVLDII